MALTRGASAGLLAALAGHFHPVLLTEADWPDGIEYIHTGFGTITWDGHLWLGVGGLVQFDFPEEAGGLTTSQATVRLATTLENMLIQRGKIIRNRPVKCWWGVTTTASGTLLVADPVLSFTGYFDSRAVIVGNNGQTHDMPLTLGIGPSARTNVSIEHSAEDQASRYPGDTSGELLINQKKRALNPPSW